jgi:hypothetical protein
MSKLCFLLSCPKHQFSKYDGVESWQLVFNNARLTKGIGKLPVSYEIHNHEIGEKAASYWETVDLSSNDVRNSAHLCMGRAGPDKIIVERPPRLRAFITLSPESFSRLLTVNWKENFILVSVTLKHPATIPEKLPFGGEDIEVPINSFCIDWEELPISPQNYLS